MSSYAEQLKRIRACITYDDPWAYGTVDVPEHFSRLYYSEKTNPKTSHTLFLNASATSEELAQLANACEPASFGRGGEDVTDESYRKAGKMDTTTFASLFNLQDLNIIERVVQKLFDGPEADEAVFAELYKLNVYGPGSFFRSHKDTPRSNKMFGSLVIVFPTAHQGGSLALRHKKEEFTFDSSRLITENPNKVAFVAFFSDVEHEVLPVTSGYRAFVGRGAFSTFSRERPSCGVVPRCNLYYSNPTPTATRVPTSIDDILHLKNNISALLDDPMFFPDGGILGFGLNFSYPVDFESGSFDKIITRLKGSDELIKVACRELGLRVNLKGIVVVRGERQSHHVMISGPVDTSYFNMEAHLLHEMIEHSDDVELIHTSDEDPRYIHSEEYQATGDGFSKEILWVTRSNEYSQWESTFMAYGNEPTIQEFYADVCLMVTVGPAGDRTGEYEGVSVID